MKKSLVLGALVVAIMLIAVNSAFADIVTVTKTGSGTTAQTATGTVRVSAAVNPKLILTVNTPDDPQSVVFPALDPMTASGIKTVTLTVSSNKKYDVQVDKTDPNIGLIGLTTSLAASTANAITASTAFPDNYQVNVPWATPAGSYTALVKYTVVQN